jgi:hypothetical protein
MKDGRLNKCKSCTVNDSKKLTALKTATPDGLEKERLRHREKYHRLNYKESQKEWDKKRPWKSLSVLKNLSRRFITEKGIELHHWSYLDKHLKDVVAMNIVEHKRLHNLIYLDIESKMFIVKKDNKKLFSKEEHLCFIKEAGFNYTQPKSKKI